MSDLYLAAPNGARIIGTLETIPGVAHIGEIHGYEGGRIQFDYEGGTAVDWNGQETVTRPPANPVAPRQRVFVDENGAEWTENLLTIKRESDEEEPEPEQPSDLTLVCELAERFLNEGEPLSSSERAAAAAALERIKAAGPDSDAVFVAVDR